MGQDGSRIRCERVLFLREESAESRSHAEQVKQTAGAANAVQVYGKMGLWYEALTAISDQIEHSPNDAGLKTTRAALLRDVGLESIAAQL